jgi:glyoxylase-like metal-dependent hydrolase (beta-lactamase superfamily II)
MRWRRWTIGFLLVLGVLLLGVKLVLLDPAASPAAPYQIDLAALHSTAVSSGPLPERIEVEQTAAFSFPRTIVVAGGGFRMHDMVLLSHRVVYPDHTSLIVDTAIGPKAGGALPGAKIDQAAYDRMQRALVQAKTIVFTHEHVDHVGGVAEAPDFGALAPRVQMTQEQLDGPKLEREQFPAGALQQLKPLQYTGLHVVAPGVVLQKAPGHTTGTQLIYVELASGARYLFVGDIAWAEDNIRLRRGRPPVAKLLMSEDRPAVAAQLVALAALPTDVHVVIAHDPVALQRDLAAGLFRHGFSE